MLKINQQLGKKYGSNIARNKAIMYELNVARTRSKRVRKRCKELGRTKGISLESGNQLGKEVVYKVIY